MSFSGGVYTLPGPALVTGDTVSATENNQFRNDVAGAFNLTMLRNGTSTATANLPMGGYKLTGLGAPSTNGDSLAYGAAAVVTTLTSTSLTATRVPYAGTGGLLQDASTFTFDGTTLTAAGFSGPLTGNVTGNVSGNAGTVTNGVYTTGDQTIDGNKTFSSNPIMSAGTANGVAYLNGSKVLTTGSALTFDGTNLKVGGSAAGNYQLSVLSSGLSGTDKVIFQITDAVNTTFQINQTTSYNQLMSNNALAFSNGTSELMRLTSTGLGIGTSSPSYKLDVTGSFRVWGGTLASSVTPTNYIASENASDSVALEVRQGRYNKDALVVSSNQALSANLLRLHENGTDRMVVTGAGNLGLGVTPSAWGFKALQINQTGLMGVNGTETDLTTNAFYDGSAGNWKYLTANAAANYMQANGQHRWYTAPSGTAGNAISFTQAMTLDASGNLLVGTTSNPGGGFGGERLVSVASSSSENGGLFKTNGALNIGTALSCARSSSGIQISFHQSGSYIGNISTNGTSTSYNTSSDYRLKENIQPMQNALARNALLKPCTYSWKADGSTGEGFIAHELQAVCPDAVTGEKDAVDKDGKPVYQGVDTSFLVGHLVACIQELKAELDQLKAKVG